MKFTQGPCLIRKELALSVCDRYWGEVCIDFLRYQLQIRRIWPEPRLFPSTKRENSLVHLHQPALGFRRVFLSELSIHDFLVCCVILQNSLHKYKKKIIDNIYICIFSCMKGSFKSQKVIIKTLQWPSKKLMVSQ